MSLFKLLGIIIVIGSRLCTISSIWVAQHSKYYVVPFDVTFTEALTVATSSMVADFAVSRRCFRVAACHDSVAEAFPVREGLAGLRVRRTPPNSEMVPPAAATGTCE